MSHLELNSASTDIKKRQPRGRAGLGQELAEVLQKDEHVLLEWARHSRELSPWLIPVLADALEGQGQVLVVTATAGRRRDLELELARATGRSASPPVILRWRPIQDYLCPERLNVLRSREEQQAGTTGSRAFKEIEPVSTVVATDGGTLQNRRKGKRRSSTRGDLDLAALPCLPEPSAAERAQLHVLAEWAERTDSGLVEERPDEVSVSVWRQCTVATSGCLGPGCPSESRCFAHRAFGQLPAATIVLCDYPTLFACLEAKGKTFEWHLPPHPVIVLEEAHLAEELGRRALGFTLSQAEIQVFVRELVELGAHQAASRIWKEALAFLTQIATYFHSSRNYGRSADADSVNCKLLLEALEGAAEGITGDLQNDAPEALRRQRARDQLLCASQGLLAAMKENQRSVTTFDVDAKGVGVVHARPMEVAGALSSLFDISRSVIVTSETLRVGSSFYFIRENLGVPDTARELVADEENAKRPQLLLVVPERLPEPSEQDWPMAVSCRFIDIQNVTSGQACAHFTSDAVIDYVQKHCRYLRARIRRDELDGPALVDLLPAEGRTDESTASESQADPYTCVILDRIPFVRADDSLLQATKELDPSWFIHFSLPRAVLAFRRALVPLLSSKLKRVVLVVLDRRILNRNYGRMFLANLPDVTISRRLEDIPLFQKGKDKS